MIIPETPKTLLDELSRQGELDELKWRQFDDIYRPVVSFFIQQRFAALSTEADDIVQDTMVRLVAVLREGKYRRDRSRFRTYLAALVHNCCIDQMRTAARRREVPIDSVNLGDISAGRDSRDAFSHLDRQWAEACYSAARRHVLEHVPIDPLHKKIFLESEQGRTSNDIARENGVSPAAVRQIKHRVSNLITTYCRDLVG